MKLIILMAVAALSSGAKLDRTYLPPSYAQTSGGNGQILEAPNARFANFQNDDFTHASSRGFGQNYPQNNDCALDNSCAQNGNNFAQNDAGLNGFNNYDQRPERPQAALDRSASIYRLDNKNDGETYSYAYETSNGIAAEENGVAVDGVKAQGGYSYTGDDGQVYSVRYTADENGFLPQGDHLPTPPPIPEEILKALEQNAQDEANGIYDDGSYNEGKYGNGINGQQSNEAGYNYNNNNGNQFNAGGDLNSVNSINGVRADDDDSIVTNNALLRSNGAAPSTFGRRTNGNQNGVERAYLPPFQQNAQQTQSAPNSRYQQVNNGLRAQANNGLNQNGVERAYLPPRQFEQNAQRTQATAFKNNAFRNGIENSYLPPQKPNQRYQQPNRNNIHNGVERAYLPPGQFGQRNQNAASRGHIAPGSFRSQPSNGVDRSYLPPSVRGQTRNIKKGFQSMGIARRAGHNREYLPPSDDQRRNGFMSGAVFDSVNSDY